MGCIPGKTKKLSEEDPTTYTPSQGVPKVSIVKVNLPKNTQIFSKISCPIDKQSSIVKTFRQKVLIQMKNFSDQQIKQFQWKSIKCPHFQSSKLQGICKWKSQSQNQLDKQGLLYSNKKNIQFLVGGVFNKGKLDKKQKYFRIFQNGAYYIGQLNNNFDPDGEGQLHTNQEEIYIGNFSEGVPHGKGKKILKDRTFSGTFKRGEIIKGKQITQKGQYEGPFQNNKKHGKGLLRMNSGISFEGDFKNNKKQGEGTLWDKQGNIKYKGVWSGDKPKQSLSM